MLKTIHLIVLALLLTGCAGPIKVFYNDGESLNYGNDKEILGIPFPELKMEKITGYLTWHTVNKQNCNFVKVEKKELVPTGGIFYAKAGGNFFTSKKINVSFHSNGYLASIGGDNSATSAGVSGFVKDIVSSVTALALPLTQEVEVKVKKSASKDADVKDSDDNDAKFTIKKQIVVSLPPCDSIFIPSKK